jgi:hypothetical protein
LTVVEHRENQPERSPSPESGDKRSKASIGNPGLRYLEASTNPINWTSSARTNVNGAVNFDSTAMRLNADDFIVDGP